MVKNTFQLKEKQATWLKEFAYKNRISQSSIIRDALTAYQEVTGGGDRVFEKLKYKGKKVKLSKPTKTIPSYRKKIKDVPNFPGICKHGYAKGLCKYGCK